MKSLLKLSTEKTLVFVKQTFHRHLHEPRIDLGRISVDELNNTSYKATSRRREEEVEEEETLKVEKRRTTSGGDTLLVKFLDWLY